MALPRLFVLALGLLLIAHPLVQVAVRAETTADDSDDVYEDDEEEGTPVIETSEKDVVVLTKANFDKVIKDNHYVLVEFYAPWCGHCKSLAPEYAEAATVLRNYEPKVVLAKVDATEEKDLGDRFNVAGFPTLYFFTNGSKSEYGGGRTSNEIVAWLKKKTGPPAVTLSSKAEAEAFLEAEKIAVVALFEKFEGKEWAAFQEVARGEEGLVFAQTTVKEAAKAAQISNKAPAMVLLKDEDEKLSVFEGVFSKESVADFVQKNQLPLVVTFSSETSDKIFNNAIKKVVITFHKTDELESLLPALQEASRANKGKLIFVTVDVGEAQANGPVAEYFGVKAETTPVVVGYNSESGKKYRMDEGGSPSLKTIKAFAEGFLGDKLKPHFKSDPIPDSNEEDVKVVVGQSFESLVLDPKKDVLLEVYAPWCGHCKALEPVWTKLGKRFRSIDSVVIAKMDGTTNEHERVSVHGFPTILFFKAGDKSGQPLPVEVEDRTLKSFTEYLKQNAGIPFELKKKEQKVTTDGEPDAKKEQKVTTDGEPDAKKEQKVATDEPVIKKEGEAKPAKEEL